MTVAAGTAVRRYDGNDIAVDFAFPEIFYNNSDLVLYHQDVNGVITNPVLDTDYTVTGAGTPTSGSIKFPIGGSSYSTLATGEKLTIPRESTKARTTDMEDAFFFDDMNLGEDKTMTMVQENALGVDRSIRRNIVDLDTINMELPQASERANKSIFFNPDGSVNVGSVITNTTTSGSGPPSSTPANLGDVYIDKTGDIFYIATGTASSADWSVASLITSQAGPPSSTPAIVGLINIDTTNKVVYVSAGTSSSADWIVSLNGMIEWEINGAGSVLTTDPKISRRLMPYSGNIIAAYLIADQSGNVVVDIWKDTFPTLPDVGDTITAAAKPTLSGTQVYFDDTLSGWTVDFASGDVFDVNVDSVATITKLQVFLITEKRGA